MWLVRRRHVLAEAGRREPTAIDLRLKGLYP